MEKERSIIHVLGQLNRGGVEVWLREFYANYKNTPISKSSSLFLLSGKEGVFDNDFKKYGLEIYYAKGIWLKDLLSHLRKCLLNDTDIILHLHVYAASGYIAFLVKVLFLGRIKVLVHSHNDKSVIQNEAGLPRKLYYTLSKLLLNAFSDIRIACSRKAADSLSMKSPIILKYGISKNKFVSNISSSVLMNKEGLKVGHVGSFTHQKNHGFILKLARWAKASNVDITFHLYGGGPLEAQIRNDIESNGLNDIVILEGSSGSIPSEMLSNMDVFVLPSMHEGLGLVVVEAQISGLTCIINEDLPKEADLGKDRIVRLSLNDNEETWLTELHNGAALKKNKFQLSWLAESEFDMDYSGEKLISIYERV